MVPFPKTPVLVVLAPAAVKLRMVMVEALLSTRAPNQTTLLAREAKSPMVSPCSATLKEGNGKPEICVVLPVPIVLIMSFARGASPHHPPTPIV